MAEYRKLIDGRIIAIQVGHPFVMTEANGWQLLLQPSRKGRLSRTDISVDQVSGWHTATQAS